MSIDSKVRQKFHRRDTLYVILSTDDTGPSQGSRKYVFIHDIGPGDMAILDDMGRDSTNLYHTDP